jgi:cobalt/nickel transport system permease protein
VSLLAVHISYGVLEPWAEVLGFVVAGALLLPAVWRVRDEEVARIALLTAALFVSSSVHVRVGPTSVHLLLNALVGVVLGRRAPLAVSVGLVLQAALLAHGAVTTLGVNTTVIAAPALLAGSLFRTLVGASPSPRRAAWVGAAVGWLTVSLTAALNAAVLILTGTEDWTIVAAPQFAIYLVLGVIEGLILGVTASYFVRVKPDLIGLKTPITTSSSLHN